MASDKKNVLVVAPHLVTPLRNGADIYIYKKWGALDPNIYHVLLIGADGIYSSDDSGFSKIASYDDSRSSQIVSLFKMLFLGIDYISAKFITQSFVKELNKFLSKKFDLIVFSFPSTYKLISKFDVDGVFVVTETHNFEPKLYRDRASESTFLRYCVAKINALRSAEVLRKIEISSPVIALGDMDFDLYKNWGFSNVTKSSLGYEVITARKTYPPSDCYVISFVGSLSAMMNVAAITEFVNKYFTPLSKYLDRKLVLQIIGSNPTQDVAKLSAVEGVNLFSNVSDNKLKELLEHSHAMIFPFDNDNGQKLKFSTCVSHGVPILSFIKCPSELIDRNVALESKEMKDWASYLMCNLSDFSGINQKSEILRCFAGANTWNSVVSKEVRAFLKDSN